jgi:type VI secretion system protein ImpH
MEIADEAAIYYSGILGQNRRSAQGLKQILEDYFAVKVQVEQFTGSWNRLALTDQTVLNDGAMESQRLGFGTIVGDEVWDQQGTVTIRLGPMPLSQYLDFLPGASAHRQLAAWLRLYSRQQLDFVVRLVLAKEDVPEIRLTSEEGEMARLGFASWLKKKPFTRDPDEATYRMS